MRTGFDATSSGHCIAVSAVAKNSSIPRLSIVVPVGVDTEAFEATLLSVLENRPVGSEILVAHDGSYQDPFELADEVRFVTTTSDSLVDQVAHSTRQARGRFVHILASGLLATCDWADSALGQFERQQTAVVAPVIRAGKAIAAAGWNDTSRGLFQPIAAGQRSIDRQDASRVLGAYLQASFWRRDVLRSIIAAFDTEAIDEANYAYGRLLLASGWSCAVATNCEVVAADSATFAAESGYHRGQRMWAIKKAIDPATQPVSWLHLLPEIFRPAGFAEKLGQINGRSLLAAIKARTHAELVVLPGDQPTVVKLPSRQQRTNTRRAA
jgi:hypothetical protein